MKIISKIRDDLKNSLKKEAKLIFYRIILIPTLLHKKDLKKLKNH